MTPSLQSSHDHEWVMADTVEYAPVDGGGHTTFILLTCQCGAVEPFPYTNYDLTTLEFRQGFVTALRTRRMFLLPKE